MSGSSGQSTASPLFVQSAKDLAVRLEAGGSAEATLLARQARALEAELGAWQTTKPTTADRHKVIERLLALQREALDLLSASR